MKKTLALFLAFSVAATFFAASPSARGGEAGGKKKIGISLMTMQYPFFQDILKGVQKAAGDQYDIIPNDANLDINAQISAIENFVALRCDAIILNAVDGTGISAALEAAAEARIPVITVDMKPVTGTFATYIGSNNRMGGELAAKWVYQTRLKEKSGKIEIALLTNALSSAAVERLGGFRDEIAKLCPNASIVIEKSGDSRETFMAAMEDILISNPNVQLVFGYSAQAGLGAYDAIVAAGKAARCSVIGFDATEEEQKEIAKGGAYIASVIQFPELLGQICLESCAKVIQGETLPADTPVEVGVYTKDKIFKAADLK